MGFDLPNKLADLKLFFTLNLNQRKHITYPSPNPTLNLTCYQLIVFSWVSRGLGVQLLRCLHSPPAEIFGTLRGGVCRGLGTNHRVISPRPLAELSRLVLRKVTYFLVGCADRVLSDYQHFIVVFVPT